MKGFSFSAALLLLALASFFFLHVASLYAHEGHHHADLLRESELFEDQSVPIPPSSVAGFLVGVGRFHFLFIHFPIALIVMTVTAELLWFWYKTPLFNYAARFLITAAAIFVIPTVLLGLALSWVQNYEGLQLELFVWHRYFGFLTAGLAILAAILKERYVREYSTSQTGYYISLFFLFLSVSLTGAFGGSLTFGLDVW